MKRLIIGLLLGSPLLLLGCRRPAPPPPPPAAAGAVTVKPMPSQIPGVLARVNGETIEKWEFDDAVRRMEARVGSKVPPERRDEALRGVLDQLIAYHLMSQASRTRKMVASDADVDARIGQIKGTFPNEEAFQQSITAQGLTVERLRTQARMSLEVARFLQTEVESKIVVADADVDAFYKQNLDRFKQGESVHARHILIAMPPNSSSDIRKQARFAAQAVLAQLNRGVAFEQVARNVSADGRTAQNGGDLGFFAKGQMPPAFEQAAFAMRPGQTSGLVETPAGFHIIRVIEHRDARTAPFEEVSRQIREFLTQRLREKKLDDFVTELRTKARIEILV